MSLVNCKVSLILAWSENCFVTGITTKPAVVRGTRK